MGATMDDWEMQAMRRRPHSFICLAPHACGVRCMLHALPLRNYPLHVQPDTSAIGGPDGSEVVSVGHELHWSCRVSQPE